MRHGWFITVEGTDGSGKTTQIKLMEAYIKEKGYETIIVREPGGTRISEKIRSIILDPDNSEMSMITEMLLYAASRAQLVSEVIKPAIEQGKVVICDRFVDSSYVYQGIGRGIELKVVEDVNRAATTGIVPDITFFFDINPQVALNRRIFSTGADRIEKEKIEFHLKVYSAYKNMVEKYPERIKSIDATKEIQEIFEDVKSWIDKLL